MEVKPDKLADDDEEDEDKEEEDEDKEEEDDALAQIRDDAEEVVAEDVVAKIEEDVEKLIDDADLTEEDFEKALEHIGEKLREADVDEDKIAELGELVESGDLETLETKVADLSEDARAKLLEAAEDIADEIEKKLGEKADKYADLKEEVGDELESLLDGDSETE
jgi:hypothetical protein